MRRIAVLLVALLTAAPSAAAADEILVKRLARQMRAVGVHSGAYVVNLSSGEPVFRWRQGTARVLASNTKLFTTAAALARFGAEGTLGTEVLGVGALDAGGVYRGDLYLRGGGDPSFGSARYAVRYYGSPGASVEELAALLDAAGIERVSGGVRGDESAFDPLRGGPESGFGVSPWVGPLSGLSFNRGFADERGRSWQLDPPTFAAGRLEAALEARGIAVRSAPRAGVTPGQARVLASVDSPSMERLVRITNKPSDNFFAEMLLKGLALQAEGLGTTAGGARLAAGYARRLGSGVRLLDGSGLSRGNRASPRQVVRLLAELYERDQELYGDAFIDSLPIAGQDGTLAERMRRGAARWRCRGKTGTLSNVSALSGYCEARSGDTYAYSILMNFVYPPGARRLQDAMLQAIAARG
ncbi:MAG TPA: D-alanyl-D-alanine carboxypeptidase/D-alanyl-D-alanine-endopeptidase [Thermoleophilaceae bacterium]|nr:D-alanyl-D-alanine carboxypeptidase/D-alanyl-D-alanine-endopeptidase [Thermoleophilaceae bacterium]